MAGEADPSPARRNGGLVTEPQWVEFKPLEPGDYPATVQSAVKGTSFSGNAVIRWTFLLEDGNTVVKSTPLKGPGAVYGYDTAQALGLGKRFKLSDATGRRCVVLLVQDGQYLNVDTVLPA